MRRNKIFSGHWITLEPVMNKLRLDNSGIWALLPSFVDHGSCCEIVTPLSGGEDWVSARDFFDPDPYLNLSAKTHKYLAFFAGNDQIG